MGQQRLVVGAYALALVVFAAIGAAAFVHFTRFGEAATWVRHTERVLLNLEASLSALKDAETAQRGLLLTNDPQFLAPYDQAMRGAKARLEEARQLTLDNPEQQRRLRSLDPIIEEKLAFTAATLQRHGQGDRAGAVEMVSSARGNQLMQAIRDAFAELAAAEQDLLAQRLEREQATGWRANVLILLGNGFAFALLATGTLLLGREMNRRLRAEEELQAKAARERLVQEDLEGKRRLETILDEMPLAVLLADPEGRVHFCNARTRALLRTAQEAPIRLNELEFLRADGTPLPTEELPITRALRGETVRGMELELRRRDTGWLPLVASAVPVGGTAGAIFGVVATFDDFTGVRRAEEERRRAQRFRDLFLSALGHDLRNPLSVVTAGTAALLRRSLPGEESKVVQRIAWSGERMSRMIDQLLDITQARLGEGIPLSPQRVELGEVARRTIERIEVSYPGRELALRARGDLGGTWDAERLGQALSYLVVNALEHGQSDRPVTVSLEGDSATQVVVEVHNWGNPIPEDLTPLIFDPFLRAAQRRRMKSTGLGLGLYLALQIAHGHGGNITLRSSVDEGTRFLLSLPRTS